MPPASHRKAGINAASSSTATTRRLCSRQQAGQAPQTWADLQHRLLGLQLGCIHHALQRRFIDQKVLPQPFIRAQAVVSQEFGKFFCSRFHPHRRFPYR